MIRRISDDVQPLERRRGNRIDCDAKALRLVVRRLMNEQEKDDERGVYLSLKIVLVIYNVKYKLFFFYNSFFSIFSYSSIIFLHD